MRKTSKKDYTITEAAALLKISRQAVHLAIQKRMIRARKSPRVLWEFKISESELQKYEARRAG